MGGKRIELFFRLEKVCEGFIKESFIEGLVVLVVV